MANRPIEIFLSSKKEEEDAAVADIMIRNMLPSELISSSSKEDPTSSSTKLYNILWSIYDTQSNNSNSNSNSSSSSISNQKFAEQQENIKQKLVEIDENITRLRDDIANLHVKIQANELELAKKLNENQQALLQHQADNQQRQADKQQDNQLALMKRQDENQQIVLKQLREAQQQQTEYQQALVKRQDDVQQSLVQQQDGRNKTILNQQEERLHSLKEYMQMYFQYLQQLLQSQHQLQMQLQQSSSLPTNIALPPPPPQQLQLTQPHITVNTASSTTASKRIAPKATAAAEDNRIIVAEKDAQIKELETKNESIERARLNSNELIRTIFTYLPNHPTANASDVTNYIRESVQKLENNLPIPDFNEWMNDERNRTLAIQPAPATQTTEQQQQQQQLQQQQQQQLDILNNSLKNWENRLHTEQELFNSDKQLLETEKAQLLSEKQLLETEKELLATEKELLAHEKNALFDIHDLEDEFVEEKDDVADYVFNLEEDLTWTLDYFIYCSYIFTNADIAEKLDEYLKNGYFKDGKPKEGSELFVVSEHLFVDAVKQLFAAGDKVIAGIFENTNNLEDRYKRIRIFYKRFGLTRRPGINTYHNYLIDMFQFFLVISRSSIIPGLSISDVPVEESFYKTPQQLLANLKKQFPSDMAAVHKYPDELFLRKFYQLNLSAIEFRDPRKTHTTEHIVLKYGLSETFLNYAYHIDTKIDFDTTKLFLRFVLLYKRYVADLYVNKKKINKHFQISVEISTIEKQKQYIIKPITNNVDLDVANWWQSIDNTTTTSTYDICDQMKKTALRLVNQINVLLVNNTDM